MTLELVRSADACTQLLRAIRELLDSAFAEPFSDEDWQHTVGGWHVTDSDSGLVVAHAAVVARDLWIGEQLLRCGYVEGVATRPDRQGQGLGTQVMETAGGVIREHFQIGALSTGRHAFYERLGWERWRGPTFVNTTSGIVRTPQDDDGVMVLRVGPSANVDLTAPITCPDRPGDAW